MSRSSGGVTMVVTSTMTTEAENTSRPKVRLTPKEFELLTEPWVGYRFADI